MALTLDTNEKAMLAALHEEDPNSEMWIWPSQIKGLREHGMDAIGSTFEGTLSVAKQLKKRGLVESDGALRNAFTGIALTDKGREALKAATS